MMNAMQLANLDGTTFYDIPVHIIIDDILKRLHCLHRLRIENTCRLLHILMPYDDAELSFEDNIYEVNVYLKKGSAYPSITQFCFHKSSEILQFKQ